MVATRCGLFFAVAMFLAGSAAAQTPPANSHAIPGGMEIQAGAERIQILAVRDDILRVRVAQSGAMAPDESWAVLPSVRSHTVNVEPLSDASGPGFRTAALLVHYVTGSNRLVVEDRAGRIVTADALAGGARFDGSAFTVRKIMPVGAHYFALGDKTGPLDRRGQTYSLWDTDTYGYQESTDPIYKSVPFYIEVGADGVSHGVLLDNTWRSWFDFGRQTADAVSFGAENGPLDYYVVYGPTPRAVVEGYAYLTGPSPLPPRWALGFQQSRWSYMSDAEVRGIANRFRSEHVPADAIYLDIDYQDRNRPFTVNAATFPSLSRLAADLRRQNLRLVAITDLHIARAPNQGYAPYDTGVAGDHFVHTPSGAPYVAPVWPGPAVFPDFTRASTRAWWGGLYRQFVADGVAGFWNDMNEPAIFETPSKTMPLDVVHRIEEPGFRTRSATHAEIHNIYGMENSRATYEGLLRLRPNERPFVLTRASFAGGHRYAMTWTGDNSATWNQLRLSVPMILNLGLSGFAYSGADVGGFVGSPSPELLTRWIEVGAFTPLFRDHTEKGSAPQEVWAHGPEQTAIRRRFIEARYRLLPYIYALADENARTGVPLMRPVFLEFPQSIAQGDPGASFMLGDDLLIAPPPTWESPAAFDVALPSAGWYDYWSGRRVAPSGGSPATAHETPQLDRLPVFVRPGAIIPRQPLVQSTEETPRGPLELHVYPGPDCHGALYWDDGHSLDYRRGASLRQRLTCRREGATTIVAFEARAGRFSPWWRQVDVVVHGWTRSTAEASLHGQTVPARVDAADETVHVLMPDISRATELRVQ